MIIGSVVAIFILVWFYNNAPKYGRNPLYWAITGIMVYFAIALFWTYFINPQIKDAAMHGRNTLLMYIARYAYIVVAFSVAAIFNLKIGPKNK
ncbi:MAG: hypothetical protein L3J59_08405 [Methylococcaceae bacterium]|nr:hypothetical protein [Methylococcaceae bacterium]